MILADAAPTIVQIDSASLAIGRWILGIVAVSIVPLAGSAFVIAYRSGALVEALKGLHQRLGAHDEQLGTVREQVTDHSGRIRVLEDRSEREAPDHEAQHHRGGS